MTERVHIYDNFVCIHIEYRLLFPRMTEKNTNIYLDKPSAQQIYNIFLINFLISCQLDDMMIRQFIN